MKSFRFIILLFCIFLAFPLTAEQKTKKVPKMSTKRKSYKITHSIGHTKKGDMLIITITPIGDYYFNGEGYPPVKLTLDPPKTVKFKQTEFMVPGIKKGEPHSWSVRFKTKLTKFTLEGTLKMIVCIGSTCEIINDDVKINIDME